MSVPAITLGIGARRCVGKDTLGQLLNRLHSKVRLYSFATALRADLGPFIHEQFGIDVWTSDPRQKEFIRPYLLCHGMAWRQRDPLHWVKRTMEAIQHDLKVVPELIPVITDTRFPNEVTYFREHYGSSYHLLDLSRKGAPPPTDEEEKHYREVQAMADFHLEWGEDTPEQQVEHARQVLAWLGLDVLVSA